MFTSRLRALIKKWPLPPRPAGNVGQHVSLGVLRQKPRLGQKAKRQERLEADTFSLVGLDISVDLIAKLLLSWEHSNSPSRCCHRRAFPI